MRPSHGATLEGPCRGSHREVRGARHRRPVCQPMPLVGILSPGKQHEPAYCLADPRPPRSSLNPAHWLERFENTDCKSLHAWEGGERLPALETRGGQGWPGVARASHLNAGRPYRPRLLMFLRTQGAKDLVPKPRRSSPGWRQAKLPDLVTATRTAQQIRAQAAQAKPRAMSQGGSSSPTWRKPGTTGQAPGDVGSNG